MEDKMFLRPAEFGLIKSALEETIAVLRNRFDEREGIVHPAIHYESLYDKIQNWDVDKMPEVYIIEAISA